MAVDPKQSAPGDATTDEILQRGGAIWAAATSVLSAAAWIVILAVHMATREVVPDADVSVYQGVWMGVFALFGILGVVELTRRLWAHQALLILAGALLVASLLHALGAAIWGKDSWWMTGMPLVAVLPVAVAAPACLWMLAAATAPKTRLRYGSVVIASAAVAIAVAGAVNLIAQKDYVRRTTQSLGRFGPSERAKQLVRSLDQPVRVTCAYTSKNPDRLGSDYSPQLLELLEDIAEYGRRHGKEITVVNAANEFDRAGVILALKDRLNTQAADHVAFLTAAAEAAPQLAADAERAAGQWQALPPNSYLAQWDLPEVMSRFLGESARDLSIQAANLESELESVALLDYGALVDQTTTTLSSTRNGLMSLAAALEQINTIPQAVAERRGPVDQALRQCIRSAAEMIEVIGQINDPVPENPAGVLRRYAGRMKEAAESAQTLSQMLPNVAGEQNARLIGSNLSWYVEVRAGAGQSRYETPQALLASEAQMMAERAYLIEGAMEFARPEYLADLLEESRGQSLVIASRMRQVVEIIREKLDQLEQIDNDTEQFLAYALAEGPVRSLLDSLDALLDQAEGLPSVEASRLAEDTQQENILIVEVGGEAEVIPFETVWPEKFQMLSHAGGDRPPRVFNGNAALSAKLMTMTSEPFAKVIITYYLPQPDPQSMAVEASPPITPEGLQTLKQRLREANFLVDEWDLTEPVPWDLEDASADGPPRVLLVLPAAKFMSRRMESLEAFEATPMGKVKTVIDGGVPAIFLSCYLRPQYRWMQEYGNFLPLQPNDFFGLYLRQDWGIELDSDYRILRVVPDERLPDKYQFDVFRYLYTPLSLFTDHPLGRPLRGHRMIWSEICPVRIAPELPDRVRAESVLAIPPAWQRDTWATNNILTVLDQWRRGRSGHIEPDFGPDADMEIPDARPGLSIAVAASREPVDPDAGQPVRIVALGVGMSVVDGYIDENVMEPQEGGGTAASDPPRANADLVVNSVLWATGKRDALAATGLPTAQPIEAMSQLTWMILWTVCVVVIPLAVVAAGGIVMIIRRS